MWRALLSRLAVASSAVVAVLAACEIALRVYAASAEDTVKTVAAEPAKIMREEQRTGWLPNEGARVERRDANGSPYVVRINSTGQRGPEVPRRRLGERRLLFLGDSYTMADQVSEREAPIRVLLGNADHESQVGVDERELGQLGIRSVVRHAAGGLDLIVASQEGDLTHLL